MFHQEDWFAWFPVTVTTLTGTRRIAWLETVRRECAQTDYGSGAWRYYAVS